MPMTINALAQLTGLTTRTLRHYDAIGLLVARRSPENNYRWYDDEHVDRLQQILLYREMGFALEEIAGILAGEFDMSRALDDHLERLLAKRQRIDQLIHTVTQSKNALKGESIMTKKDKFEGLKETIIAENEAMYGEEIRERWGDETIDKANAKVRGLTEAQYERAVALEAQIKTELKTAVEQGDPKSPSAQLLVQLHRDWLSVYWPKGLYSPEMHMNMGEMYIGDARFKKYYDDVIAGGAQFLRDAIIEYYS